MPKSSMAIWMPRLTIPFEHAHGTRDVLHHHAFGDLELEQVRRHAADRQRLIDVLQQAFVDELARRKVDRHRDRPPPFALPDHVLRAGLPEHPAADRNDQAGFFGKRNEFARRQHRSVLMAPAQQRLDAGDRAGVQIDLGLVMQQQLVALQRVPEVRLHREPLDRPGPGVAGEEPETVLAVALDQIHRPVGVPGQGPDVGAVGRIDRHADRGRDVTFVTAELDRLAQRSQQIACNAFDVLARCDILQKQDELVAAEPGHHVASPHAAPQPDADLGQQPVARVMPEGIVDDLEAVEIDEQHGQLPVVRGAPVRWRGATAD